MSRRRAFRPNRGVEPSAPRNIVSSNLFLYWARREWPRNKHTDRLGGLPKSGTLPGHVPLAVNTVVKARCVREIIVETLLQRNDVVRNVLEMLLWRLASRLYAHDPARYWNYQYPSFIGSSTMSAIAISRLPRGCASQYPPPRRAPGPSGHRQPESPWSTHQIPRSG